MPDVLIRNMPGHIYEELQHRAKREHRSIPSETIHLLEQLFQQDEMYKRHQAAMQRIIERSADQPRLPDSLPLLREDRER